MDFVLKQLDIRDIGLIRDFFVDVFTHEPWNDDWSNEKQLEGYLTDLIGNANSLTLGYFSDTKMVGLSMGHIRHWYAGTEYYIDEFCISRNQQGLGIGTQFLRAVEQYIVSRNMTQIFLQTERNVPAYHFYRKNQFTELSQHVSFVKKLNSGR